MAVLESCRGKERAGLMGSSSVASGESGQTDPFSERRHARRRHEWIAAGVKCDTVPPKYKKKNTSRAREMGGSPK